MRGALSDRFLLASLSILLVASLAFGYFIFEDSGIGLAFGQELTGRQKARAIDIAMSDLIVKQEIGSRATNNSYHVIDVLSPSTVQVTGPDLNRNRTLPAVEIALGDEKLKGFNMLVFVDLSGSRVAYIGYTKRPDIYDQVPQENYTNISIAETSYILGDILTGEQRTKAIEIAVDDKTVQEKMGGRNYTVEGDVIVSNLGRYNGDNFYVGAYPFIIFTEGTSIYEPDFIVYVTVDLDKSKVLNSMVVVRTPVLPETPRSHL